MKKKIITIATLGLAFALASCNVEQSKETTSNETTTITGENETTTKETTIDNETTTTTENKIFYTVTFNTNGGSFIEARSVEENTQMNRPNDPIKEGYIFKGWYLDSELTEEFSVKTLITEDITLYAAWAAKSITISFDTMGGEKMNQVYVSYNATLTKPNDPIREGYTFIGWYKDSTLEKEYDFDSIVKSSFTLYAKWEIISCNVTLNLNNGEDSKVLTLNYGSSIEDIELPKRQGYTFKGWYLDSELKNAYLVSKPITEDVTLYAKWIESSYFVTFISNNDEDPLIIEVEKNKSVEKPIDPIKEGHTFLGWYSDIDCTIAYDFNSLVTKGITLYAKWEVNTYTVTFSFNGTTHQENYSYGTKAVSYTEVDKYGYVFDGWYLDTDFEKPYSFDELITDDLTLYAKYSKDTFTVSFITPANTTTVDVLYQDTCQRPEDPTIENFIFLGWYSDIGLTIPFDFDAQITKDTSIYAKFISAYKTVTFDSLGGSSVEEGSVYYNQKVERPLDPTYTGHTFLGWYSDIDCTIAFDFDTLITEDMTLYAKWEINSYTITFNANNGTENIEKTVEYNNMVEAPSAPKKLGYNFIGWYSDIDCTIAFDFDTLITEDMTLYAKWEERAINTTFELSSDGTYYIVSGVTSLDETDIWIPATYNDLPVKKIKDSAFLDNTKITTIAMSDSIEEIGANAFKGLTYLSSITLSSGLTTIGTHAFDGDKKLKSVTLPENVSTVGSYAFYGCISLESIVLSSSMTAIPEYCFYNTYLASITIPDSIETIGGQGFSYCENLSSVTFGSGLKTIKSYGFYNCVKLESISLPEGLETIEQYAFQYAKALTSASLPTTLTTIGHNAFDSCEKLNSITIPAGVAIIPTSAFEGCKALEELTFLGDVTEIGDYAFSECYALKSVTLPNSLNTLGDHAFNSCRNMTSLTLSTGLTVIPASCFSDCRSLEELTLPNSILTIEQYAFNNCEAISELVLPTELTTIEGYAFKGLSNITRLYFSPKVTTIGSNAFENCTKLRSLLISSSVDTIASDAFKGCYRLVDVCNLSSISIEAGSTANGYVGYYALRVSDNEYDSSRIHVIDDVVYYYDGTNAYVIDYMGTARDLWFVDGVDINSTHVDNIYIHDYAFYQNEALENIVLDNSVKEIGDYALDASSIVALCFNSHNSTDNTISLSENSLVSAEMWYYKVDTPSDQESGNWWYTLADSSVMCYIVA